MELVSNFPQATLSWACHARTLLKLVLVSDADVCEHITFGHFKSFKS